MLLNIVLSAHCVAIISSFWNQSLKTMSHVSKDKDMVIFLKTVITFVIVPKNNFFITRSIMTQKWGMGWHCFSFFFICFIATLFLSIAISTSNYTLCCFIADNMCCCLYSPWDLFPFSSSSSLVSRLMFFLDSSRFLHSLTQVSFIFCSSYWTQSLGQEQLLCSMEGVFR